MLLFTSPWDFLLIQFFLVDSANLLIREMSNSKFFILHQLRHVFIRLDINDHALMISLINLLISVFLCYFWYNCGHFPPFMIIYREVNFLDEINYNILSHLNQQRPNGLVFLPFLHNLNPILSSHKETRSLFSHRFILILILQELVVIKRSLVEFQIVKSNCKSRT